MNQRILILGSTGNVGKPLVELLSAAGETVVAASRNSTTARLDFTDPSTFAPVLEGVDRIFLVFPPGYLDVMQLMGPFLEVAFQKPRKFVMQSADGVQFNEQAPLRQLELLLEKSGHRYVLLRPNWFMDNFHTFWLPAIQAAGVIPLPAGDASSAFIDARDIAASAFAALTTDSFDNQAFSLSGPEALTYTEAAAILSRAAGKTIRYQHVEDSAFIDSLVNAGVPKDYSEFLAILFSFVRQGYASTVTDGVKTLTGKAPIGLEEYAQRNASKFLP
ncbi:MAG: SDR family oxidoreductase [Acidobacteria bacterium]|nr:SDR family oxidoreductase [Acidobacteriota bacterium]